MNWRQLHSAILGGIGAIFLAAPGTLNQTPSANDTALMVVAHGSRDTNWNSRVVQSVERLNWDGPKGVAFLTGKPPEHALPRVAAQLDQPNIRQIVVVPLLISSYSSHYEEIRYYVGQRADMPEHHEEPASPGHPGKAREPASPARLTTNAKLALASAMDSHPLLSRILRDQVKPLVEDASNESLVLIAHGPNEDGENERWLEHLRVHTKHLQAQLGFRRAMAVTLRDDAPKPIRDAATEQLRTAVRDAAADSRVIVLPALISVGHLQKEIRERLSGLAYVMAEGGVATHPLTTEWIRQQGTQVPSDARSTAVSEQGAR
jgi:sirohydrochlorin ferrochelatase